MPEIGQTFAHYTIVEKTGEGGMGVVYKARDTHLDRFVALKVLPPEKVADPDRKRRFVQEAKAASALNHPNIITIYDIDQADGTDFIAMEYVAGKSLNQRIRHRGLRLNDALKYAVQIADALTKAHSAGIVHRDLKPTNIMVNEDGVVKVLDFGLAKLTEQNVGDEFASTTTIDDEGRHITEQGVIVGTVAYMSPEQAEGKKVDARSDIFSLGSVLYELVTGQKAFQGTSKMATLSAILNQEPKPISDITQTIPTELEKLVNRCLRKDPEKRFQHMDDVKIALDELKEDSDSGKLTCAGPPVKRYRRRFLAALLALPLLVAAGWLFLKYGSRRPPLPTLIQLTSYPGSELEPSFSPDGRQVAFAWNGETEDNYDIYVKLVGEANALRLTTDPAPELWPAWSPDGRRIAFRRNRPGSPGIWLVSPLGGAEQKLADLQTMGQMSWSPDGKWLAVAMGISNQNVGDVRGIFLLPLDGGEPRRLSDPKAPAFDTHPSFSPDGRLLAWVQWESPWSSDLFVQQLDTSYLPREKPRRITRQRLHINGLAWSRDGGFLVYGGSLTYNLTPRLWHVESSGRRQPERIDLAGYLSFYPSIALAGDRLAFSSRTTNLDVWRYELGGVPEPFLKSSLPDYSAQFSPDGSRIAFSSCRSGDMQEIWTANADGSHLVQLTKDIGRGQGSPCWSPDGRLIAFDSQGQEGLAHIWVVDASGGRPRRVSSGDFSDHVPRFSRDGKWIYFYSNRTGRDEVWRVPPSGGATQQITDSGGNDALESTDGRTLFYVKGYTSSPLFARSPDGGPERQILDYVTLKAFAVFDDGIYYIGRPGADRQYPIQFYDFSTRSSRLITKVEGPLEQGLSLSQDRRTILFTKSATSGADLMLIESFR